jgi:hypothetical protein
VGIKSLFFIDLNSIIEAVNKSVLLFSLEYEVKNVNDLTNLFISRVLLNMVEKYKENKSKFIFFFISETDKEKIINHKDFINYKKFFNLIYKKIGFPLLSEQKNFVDYCEEIRENELMYEELVTKYVSFSEIFPKFANVVRKYRYKKVDNDVIKEIKNLVNLLSSI